MPYQDIKDKFNIRIIIITFFGVAISNMGFGMILPFLPIYAEKLGASSFIIGLMFSSLSIGRMIFQIPGGHLSDKKNPIIIACLGIFIFVPIHLAFFFIRVPIIFIILRFLEGIAEGITIPSLYMIITKYSRKDFLGRNFGLFSSFATGGIALGPIFGSLFYEKDNPQIIFLISAILASFIAACFFVLFIKTKKDNLNKSEVYKKNKSIMLIEIIKLLLNHNILPVYALSFITKFAFAFLQIAIPIYIAKNINIKPNLIAIIFTINFIAFSVFQPINGFIVDKKSKAFNFITAMSLLILSFFIIPFIKNYFIFIFIFIIEIFSSSWLIVFFRNWIAKYKKTEKGKMFGFTGAVGDIGAVLGPLYAGVFLKLGEYSFIIISILATLILISSIHVVYKEGI